MMYKVTAEFIYRAKLYPIGREIAEIEYNRIIRDRVAVKRGIPEKVAPRDPPPAPAKKATVEESVAKPEKKVKKEPTPKKKAGNKPKR